MPREDWRIHDGDPRRPRDDLGQADYSDDYGYDPRRRAGYRTGPDVPPREDYGQADYSTDYVYDYESNQAYRRDSEEGRRAAAIAAAAPEPERRSFVGGMFRPRDERARDERPVARRKGPSDRVLWAIIVERLEDERRLDLSDLEVIVENAEVTLNGTVRHKEDKRRIEDVADLDDVRHVQNNLRVRHRHGWF